MLKVKKLFTFNRVIQGLFRFIIEVYFELFISAILIIGMYKTNDYWNRADKICVGFQIVLLIISISFAIFVVWFTAVTIKPFLYLKRQNRETWYLE